MTREEIIENLTEIRDNGTLWSLGCIQTFNSTITAPSRRPTVDDVKAFCDHKWREYVFGDEDSGEPQKAEAYQDVIGFIEEGKC